MRRAKRSLAAYLAIVAIALNGFLPFVAQAKASRVLVPVCSIDGGIHFIEIPGGGSPYPEDGHKHCWACTASAERVGLASGSTWAGFRAAHPGAGATQPAFHPRSPHYRSDRSRAPPAFPPTSF